jgi:hypothetical protein
MSPQRQCSVSRATPVTGLRFIKRSAGHRWFGRRHGGYPVRPRPPTLVQYPSFSISSSSKPK